MGAGTQWMVGVGVPSNGGLLGTMGCMIPIVAGGATLNAAARFPSEASFCGAFLPGFSSLLARPCAPCLAFLRSPGLAALELSWVALLFSPLWVCPAHSQGGRVCCVSWRFVHFLPGRSHRVASLCGRSWVLGPGLFPFAPPLRVGLVPPSPRAGWLAPYCCCCSSRVRGSRVVGFAGALFFVFPAEALGQGLLLPLCALLLPSCGFVPPVSPLGWALVAAHGLSAGWRLSLLLLCLFLLPSSS